MQFSTATIIAVSALFSTLALAAPHAPVSSGKRAPRDVTTDDILKHLQDNGDITWTAAGSGHFVDITEDVWYNGISAVSNSTESGDEILARGLETRGVDIGKIQGFSATMDCKGGGSAMSSDVIGEFSILTDACAALVGASSKNLGIGSLKVWQSGPLKDATGANAYVRYGFQKVTDITFDSTLCVDTLKSFSNNPVRACANLAGNTKGGEILIGKSVKFSADPNQVGCNC